MQDIRSVVGLLSQQPVFQDWNLSIEEQPIDMKGQSTLAEPLIFK